MIALADPEPPENKPQGLKLASDQEERFCKAYTTPGTDAWHNGARAAVAAGYSEKAQWSTGTRLLKRERVRARIAALEQNRADQLAAQANICVGLVQARHLYAMVKCEAAGDWSNWTRNLEALGRTVGAYDGVQVDGDRARTYTEAERREAKRLSGLLLELGRRALPEPASDVIDMPSSIVVVTPQGTQDANGVLPA